MLAEALWNLNPNFPERRKEWQFIENIPLLKELIPPMYAFFIYFIVFLLFMS
ncbi:hypothetical protein O3M35_011315 [Rhynocoris fuscipes]|uniref:Uncharacterized protein n=1 Tax=Rhynocoris fuscipes TaxID=488301 RepID=A0AAW1D096_9HEMI